MYDRLFERLGHRYIAAMLLAIPVVVFPDGTHFTEPTDAELADKLDEAIAA